MPGHTWWWMNWPPRAGLRQQDGQGSHPESPTEGTGKGGGWPSAELNGVRGSQGEWTESGQSIIIRHWGREGGLVGGPWTLSIGLSVDSGPGP